MIRTCLYINININPIQLCILFTYKYYQDDVDKDDTSYQPTKLINLSMFFESGSVNGTGDEGRGLCTVVCTSCVYFMSLSLNQM